MYKRILIADNNYIASVGLATILQRESPKIIIDCASDETEIVKSITAHQYDVIFLDIDIPDLKSADLIPIVKKHQPDIKILIFTDQQLQDIMRFINNGINGYLNKKSNESEIRAAFRTILKTGFFYQQEAVAFITNILNERRLLKNLSGREREVFEFLAKGKTNTEISSILTIKPSTVSTFKKKIFKKLGVKNIFELTELHQKLY